MIILGSYPELKGANCDSSVLKQLKELTDSFVPSSVVIHILPPYPTSGDGGFAPNDWFSVRSELGTWEDLVTWAKERRIILDGIYNHVGINHNVVKEFFENPSEESPLYACRGKDLPSPQLSPRGGTVYHQYQIKNETWQLWQTFSKDSVDIRISHPRIYNEINKHMSFLQNSGIYGIRLDGCAYYGHDVNFEQFHNPDSKKLSHILTELAAKHQLFVLAQLDADPIGASYFHNKEGWSTPVVDYAYSAVLTRAILSESADPVSMHVERTKNLPCSVIRPPRTHDGILLQSDLLTKAELAHISELTRDWQLPVRSANGEDYEINSSLPFICSLGVNDHDAWQRVLLIVALTVFIPGIPYFYLPFIVGDKPEDRVSSDGDDPRTLNRTRINKNDLERFISSEKSSQLKSILEFSEVVNRMFSINEATQSKSPVDVIADRSKLVIKLDGCYLFMCNFSSSVTCDTGNTSNYNLAISFRHNVNTIEPLGFGVWLANN